MCASKESVIHTTQQISRLWRAAKWDELRDCFAPGIVQVGPRTKELSRGCDAAIGSYRQFVEGARLTDYHEENFRVEVWPGFALCVYEWRMKYVTDGERRCSSGTYQFLFQEDAARQWTAVWRHLDFWEDKKEE